MDENGIQWIVKYAENPIAPHGDDAKYTFARNPVESVDLEFDPRRFDIAAVMRTSEGTFIIKFMRRDERRPYAPMDFQAMLPPSGENPDA